MARILAVGIATLDIINQVDGYPAEDSEQRAVAQQRRLGGNAANTLSVLAQLGHGCSWAGNWVDEPDGREVLAGLAANAIDTRHAVRFAAGRMPTSYVTLNRANGSRTILHHRDLAEYAAADFQRIDLSAYDWLHFEGRAPDQLRPMLQRARDAGLRCSLEIEKPRPGIEALFELADVLLFGRDYAVQRGFDDALGLLSALCARLPDQPLSCTWGSEGVWFVEPGGEPRRLPAEPVTVVDTLGAGDVFNAGVIDALLGGSDWPAAVAAGSRLAARKVARMGLAGLADG